MLNDVNGRPRSIAEWQGKALVINFWATWCPPCLEEIPLLQALHAEHAGQVQVVGIAVDRRQAVADYAGSRNIGYPLLVGEQQALDVAAAFGVDAVALPFTVFANAAGSIVAVTPGELSKNELDGIVDAVLEADSGDITLAQARARIEALRR